MTTGLFLDKCHKHTCVIYTLVQFEDEIRLRCNIEVRKGCTFQGAALMFMLLMGVGECVLCEGQFVSVMANTTHG